MLTKASLNASNYTNYKYDANGLRRQKRVCTNGQTVTTDFIWGNNGLAGFVQGDNTVTVLYDQENQPAGFTLNGVSYSYIKNLQGDVLKVLDSTGAEVVSYTYDPWGVPTATGDEPPKTKQHRASCAHRKDHPYSRIRIHSLIRLPISMSFARRGSSLFLYKNGARPTPCSIPLEDTFIIFELGIQNADNPK